MKRCVVICLMLLLCRQAFAGGCGVGGAGFTCQSATRTYWNDEDYQYWSSFRGAMGERSGEMFPNFYRAGNWAMRNVVGPAAQVAFSPWMERNVWTTLSQTPPDFAPGPYDNPLAIGMIGLGRWGKAEGRLGSFLERWLSKLGTAESLPGQFGGSASRLAQPELKALEGLERAKAHETGKFMVHELLGAIGTGRAASSLVITKEIAGQNEGMILNDLMSVVNREVARGKPSTGFLTIPAYVDPATGALSAIGKSSGPAGSEPVLFRVIAMAQKTSEGSWVYKQGFHKLITDNLDPTIALHLEELAKRWYPTVALPIKP